MKTTIHKYMFNEIWPSFVTSLLAFIFVMLAAKMVEILEWIINYGVSPLQVFSMIFCLLPGMVLFALPAATLMAVFTAFLRLSSDNEIQALKTSGVSLYQMLPAAVFVSCVALVIAMFISLVGAPWGTRSLSELLFEVAYSKVDIGIKERVFSEPFSGVTFYVSSFSPKEKTMRDLFLVDKRDPSMTSTIVAKEGRIVFHPKSRKIILHFDDGTIFITDKNLETARTIQFNGYDLGIDPPDPTPSASSRGRDPKEMGLRELRQSLKTMAKRDSSYNEAAIHLMERFSIPLAVLFMGIIGVPLGAQMRSGGRLVGIVGSLFVFLIYYLFLAGARNIGETGLVSPFFISWLPIGFLLVSSVFLLRRASQEKTVNLLSRLVAIRE